MTAWALAVAIVLALAVGVLSGCSAGSSALERWERECTEELGGTLLYPPADGSGGSGVSDGWPVCEFDDGIIVRRLAENESG